MLLTKEYLFSKIILENLELLHKKKKLRLKTLIEFIY